jgi:hypothetical protein
MRATHLAVTAAAMLTAAIASTAEAATCADRPVSARGEASRLEVLAKAKARGNWRAKVRALPDLGAAYADWYKAQGADYSCSEEEGGTVCTAVALPCRD